MTITEWDDGPASAAVLRAVAAEEGRQPESLPPLYEAIDPDALNDIVDRGSARYRRVRFTYAGYEITVATDGVIELEPAQDEAE